MPDLSLVRDVIVPVIAVVTLGWAIYVGQRSWRDGLAIRTADFVRGYTNDFYASDEMRELFSDMDYDRFAFDASDLGTDAEVSLDRLLDFFNTVGLAVSTGIVDVNDLRRTTIGYAARRAWENDSVAWYLKHVEQFDPTTGELAFGYFKELGHRLVNASVGGQQSS